MSRRLHRNSPIPLYEQLKAILAEDIRNGKLAADEQIPSERELCEKYDVSRITVRQAIAEAVNEGLLYRTRGRGTFVSGTKIEQQLKKVNSFQQTLVNQGLIASTSLLKAEPEPNNFFLSRILNTNMLDQVIHIQLVGSGNNVPVVFYDSYFASEIGENMMKEAKLAASKKLPFSTLDLYGEKVGVVPTHVEQTFEAIPADSQVSEILQIPVQSPIFLSTSIIYKNEQALEFKLAYYRGDKYKFYVTRDFHHLFQESNMERAGTSS